jgi:hypothetical protein
MPAVLAGIAEAEGRSGLKLMTSGRIASAKRRA